MAKASIPVDPFNPGQVFACLGFLEVADAVLGDAEGGFDWSDESRVRFLLHAAGHDNPFETVLQFLTEAEIRRCAPNGYSDPPRNKKGSVAEDDDDDVAAEQPPELSETFPSRKGDRMALPLRLDVSQRPSVLLGHWADGSGRDDFKLYAGNRSAASIARAMLRGTREKPKKLQSIGDVKTRGVDALWRERRAELTASPFDVLTVMGGSFNFDPRGAWTAIDAGFSPDQQKKAGTLSGIEASPVVELLAALGLEHARPDEFEARHVRYGVWSRRLPPVLARPALSGANVGVPVKTFRFVFGGTKHNKVVTFARAG